MKPDAADVVNKHALLENKSDLKNIGVFLWAYAINFLAYLLPTFKCLETLMETCHRIAHYKVVI